MPCDPPNKKPHEELKQRRNSMAWYRRYVAPRKAAFLVIALLALTFVPVEDGLAAERTAEPGTPAEVVQSYVRATYARDFVEAYRLISSEDRKIRDVNRYVQQRGAFSGFILEAAKKLSEAVEIKSLQQTSAGGRVQLVVRYRVPDTKSIAPTLLNWDPYRVNSLNAPEREQLLAILTTRQRDHSLEMIEGEEQFDLVKESNGWRVFLNWAAGIKIPLRLDLSKITGLEVALSKQEVALQPGAVFQVELKIRNKTHQPVVARIGHLIEPVASANFLEFVQCGFLLPVTIPTDKEQVYSGTYMVRASLPEGVRRMSITYDFRILK